MKQILLVTLLGLAFASAAAAESASERDARCEKQGEIIAKAAEARLARTREAKAKEEIMESTEEDYKTSVPLLVGYIYTLPRKDLKAADPKLAFVEQCSGFDPDK
ncbi:hypothetical protein KO498_17515 [Lentibacter algarum]|uniref:hypothetical protein n=1 Tax=Lentibacter algarum TaxID=576131 RepID=UPI001C099F02|nr:hypothetical protein [Lentibacter algarum]MBU2983610.1 hypothetical protein [Lentibacter algarum]